MRVTFSSSFRDMAYDYCLKHRMPMCEIKLNQTIAKIPRHIYRLNGFSINPFTRSYTNQEILFVN